MSLNPHHTPAQYKFKSQIKEREAQFWKTIYPVHDETTENTYSPITILRAIFNADLDTQIHLYKPALQQPTPHDATLWLHVSDHSPTISYIIFRVCELPNDPLNTATTDFELCIVYKAGICPDSIDIMQQIVYHMSYPSTLTEAVYPYVSLMALPNAHHSVVGTLPITQEWSKSIFDRFSQILWELANDETFIQRYDPINLQQNPEATEMKWAGTHHVYPRDRMCETVVGDDIHWKAIHSRRRAPYFQCTFTYVQSLFLNAKNFVQFIQHVAQTLAPGLPHEYKHVVASSMSTKQRKAWSTMSEQEIENSRSIFNKLPPALVEQFILGRKSKPSVDDETDKPS